MAFTFRLGECVGGDNLTMSTECWLATKNNGSPFSLCPPPTTKGVLLKRSLPTSLARFLGGTEGGERNTSSGDWRRFWVSCECPKFWRKNRLGEEAMGADARDNAHLSGLFKGDVFLKFSKLRTGLSCKIKTQKTCRKTLLEEI